MTSMRVLLAGAHGRLGGRVLTLLLDRGHQVRAFVRTESQAAALRSVGAEAVVGDLTGDVEWAAEGCDATVFAAGARHRGDLGAVDAAGAAKIAEAAHRYEHERFVLCSVIGADHPERRRGGVREFLAAKHQAERRLAGLELRWTILRLGRLTEEPGTGRIDAALGPDAALTINRDDAALTVVEALGRSDLSHRAIPVIDGDRPIADALDAIPPRPLPPPATEATGPAASLGAAQSDNPPDAPDMIFRDAVPLDSDVDFEGDGPVPAAPVENEDPAPPIP
jgi:nucleoside-diphosphate-sugar epimerase